MKYFYYFTAIAASIIFISSCTIVKEYPVNRPFVYETNIEIEGKYSTDERKQLKAQLEQQLHDSVRVRRQRKFLFWHTLRKPAAYDSLNAGRSKVFMKALLNSLGYYRDSISFSDTVKIVDDQQRATVNFNVIPGKLIRLDSIWYDLLDSVPYMPEIDTLQKITQESLNESLLKKGDPFSKPLISAELDRLSDVYRNNGFLRFSKEQLIAVWDTVGLAFIRPPVDIVEQIEQMEALRRRRENPVADVEIRLKSNPDTSRLTRYYIGDVKVYADYSADTMYYRPKIEIMPNSRIQFISYEGLFNHRKLIRFVYLRHGDLYRQSNYLRTQNKFNSLGAWRLVTINQLTRPGQDTVDFEVRLIPTDKYSTSINFDVSRNQGNLASEGNLIGLGTTFTLINRNFAKAANQATTNLRYGIELTSRIDSVQTQQFLLSHTVQFPRLVPRLLFLPDYMRENGKTFLSLNAGWTDRIKYYSVTTLNASWGYEFTWKNKLLTVRVPNIEFNILEQREGLRNLIDSNASFKYIFNDGLINSGLVNFTVAGGKKNKTTVGRISVEESNWITGIFFRNKPTNNNKLYRFLKIDAEYTQTYKIRRTAIAWRIFGGIGYGMPFHELDSSNIYMPFFRQYYAGGPNSMRAWSVRKLGPGSSNKSFSPINAPDRFGDIRLELNAEYRFYMTELFGFPLEGALFTDIGNVWFRRKNNDFPDGEFKFNRLFYDLAVGVGTGLRWDFGFLKARFDFAWKAKDPSPEDPAAENKWFYNTSLRFGNKGEKQGAQFQLGINYPF